MPKSDYILIMKRLFLISLALIFCGQVFAENFFEVEWSEFCPRKYQNIDSSSFHLTRQGRYWADRKQQFDKRVAKCKSLSQDSQSACFESLRALETKATEAHANDTRNNVLKYMMINTLY